MWSTIWHFSGVRYSVLSYDMVDNLTLLRCDVLSTYDVVDNLTLLRCDVLGTYDVVDCLQLGTPQV